MKGAKKILLQTGDIIRYRRKENTLTQVELAKKLNIKLSTLQKYESGAIQNIKIDTLKKICDILQISPFVLIYPEHIRSLRVLKKYYLIEKRNKYISKLNEEGTEKVIDYVKDLYDTGKYFD